MPHVPTVTRLFAEAPVRHFALFNYGFRPFFLFAGVYALAMVPIWLWVQSHGIDVMRGAAPMYWHAHEMFYGFVCAAIAGFLLTAVPSWTGDKGFGGLPLIALFSAWLLGRVGMALIDVVPLWIVTLAELSFLPGLVALVGYPLLRARNRNTPLLLVLFVLWCADAAFMYGLRMHDNALLAHALRIAIDVCLVLLTVIAGRIVPSFTMNALRRRGDAATLISHPWLERTTVALMVALAVADMGWMDSKLSAAIAGLAAIAHAWRLSGWRSLRTRGEAILWVLHVGYAWLPVGLALRALAQFGIGSYALYWQHAITVGAFTTMILAVMTRASLGHTGRPLKVSVAIKTAYLLLTLAGVVRVFLSAMMPAHYVAVLTIAGTLWSAAFLIYLVEYAPIFIGPRADGKPG